MFVSGILDPAWRPKQLLVHADTTHATTARSRMSEASTPAGIRIHDCINSSQIMTGVVPLSKRSHSAPTSPGFDREETSSILSQEATSVNRSITIDTAYAPRRWPNPSKGTLSYYSIQHVKWQRVHPSAEKQETEPCCWRGLFV
ncbi:hypothetical protein CBOM_08035 [Ceraceosorus bombacis]|uniref:Uncharacterized protein n=1 Tax=Ceraceosorus bombacis TaxID=401625 RepID=A0A0P1BJA9_9BASI|nr:hypothetical protein CBOM_08035 [Ceraceosorus bombacis]